MIVTALDNVEARRYIDRWVAERKQGLLFAFLLELCFLVLNLPNLELLVRSDGNLLRFLLFLDKGCWLGGGRGSFVCWKPILLSCGWYRSHREPGSESLEVNSCLAPMRGRIL